MALKATSAPRKNLKTAAATAAGSFAVSNPLIAAFLVGLGAALWWSYKQRKDYSR